MVFSGQSKGHAPKNRIWNEPICLVKLSAYISIYLKVKDYKNKMRVKHWIQTREILISSQYQVPQHIRTGVYQHVVCCTVYLRKMMLHMIETFCELQIHWTFPLCCCCSRLDFHLVLTSFICSHLNCEYHCAQSSQLPHHFSLFVR